MATTQEVLNAAQLTFFNNPPEFLGTQVTTSTSIATGFTWVSINFADSAGIAIDNYGGHSTSVNNTRYTAQVAGWYTVSGVVAFISNATGFRASRIAKNGTQVMGFAASTTAATSLSTAPALPTRAIQLNVGDYIELQGLQNSGGTLTTNLGTDLASSLWVKFAHQ